MTKQNKPTKHSSMGPPPPNPNLMQQAQPPPPPTEDQVRLGNEVQKARDALYAAINQYKSVLQDTVLASNRSKSQNDERMKVLANLNDAHGQLERVNVGEGPLALTFAALHAVMNLKDEINELKFQNTMLYKKLKEIKTDAAE